MKKDTRSDIEIALDTTGKKVIYNGKVVKNG